MTATSRARRAHPSRAAGQAVVALALLGAVVGCSSSHAKPAPSSSTTRAATGAVTEPPSPGPASARAALGDFRTLDPCSLVEPAALAALGHATFGDPQSLDYCVVRLATAADDIELHVGELVTAAPPGPGSPASTPAPRAIQRLSGGQQVTSGSPGPAGCEDRVTYTDQIALLVSAAPASGVATATTCAATDAALQGVLDAVSGGQVTHRRYARSSYGPVDACAVLTPRAVTTAVRSVGSARAIAHPAGHQCEYGDQHSTYVALLLAAAYARFDGGPGSTTLTVARHPVVLVPEQPDGRAGECVGYGPHIAFPSRSGQPAMEMAELHVALPSGATDAAACAQVRALAATVFAHLP